MTDILRFGLTVKTISAPTRQRKVNKEGMRVWMIVLLFVASCVLFSAMVVLTSAMCRRRRKRRIAQIVNKCELLFSCKRKHAGISLTPVLFKNWWQ